METRHKSVKYFTMPSATITKTASAGTKRKSAPVKNVHVKGSKKPKIEGAAKSALKKGKSAPQKKVEVSSEEDSEDSEDSESDGGVALNHQSKKGGSEEEDDEADIEEEEDIPIAADGLHPERAKAVVTNSEDSATHCQCIC